MSGQGDIVIDGVLYQRGSAEDGAIVRQDSQPGTSRAAMGEGRYDYFQNEGFVAQANLSGGMGQERLVAQDRFATGLADTTKPGHIFPARRHRGTLAAISPLNTRMYGLNGLVRTMVSENRPQVSGRGAAIAVRNGSIYRYDAASGVEREVTPTGAGSFELVRPLGRFLFGFSRVETVTNLSSGATVVQFADAFGSGLSRALTLDLPVLAGNVLVIAVSHAITSTGTAATLTMREAGWTKHSDATTTGTGVRQVVFYKVATASEPLSYNIDGSASGFFSARLIEGENVDTVAPISDVKRVSSAESGVTGGTTVTSSFPSVAMNLGEVLSSAVQRLTASYTFNSVNVTKVTVDGASTSVGNFVGDTSSNFSSGGNRHSAGLAGKTAWTAFTYTRTSSSTSGSRYSGHQVVLLKGSAVINATSETLDIYYSSDDGLTWTKVNSEIGGAIGALVEGLPAMGALWISTEEGLFRFAYEEYQFENGTTKVNIGMTGPVDKWPTPLSAGVGGRHMCIHEQVLYYSAGSSIRRFQPGGGGVQEWPKEDWSGPVNEIKSIEASEAGVFFSAGGFLHLMSGRGIHQLASEPSVGAFNKLFFFRGKLYFNTPSTHFRFDYPSARPDMYTVDPLDFTTGYVVSSAIDMDKVSLEKVISRFETHTRFSAQATTSGSLTLQFLSGDGTGTDPGKLGGGATSLTWTTIGTHTFSDGGVKVYTRGEWLLAAQEIRLRKIYLRLVINVGTTGFPIVEVPWVAQGVAIMPDRKTLSVPLSAAVGRRDNNGTVLYPTKESVLAVVANMEGLRAAGLPFNLTYDDGTPGGKTYRVVMGSKIDQLSGRLRDNAIEFTVAGVFQELP